MDEGLGQRLFDFAMRIIKYCRTLGKVYLTLGRQQQTSTSISNEYRAVTKLITTLMHMISSSLLVFSLQPAVESLQSQSKRMKNNK